MRVKGKIMKTGPLSILALLFLSQAGNAATRAGPGDFELRCEREMHAQILVRTQLEGYRVDNSVGSARLSNRSAHAYASELLLGLTSVDARSEVDFDAPSLSDVASARECVAPTVSVTLVLPPLDVYVAREFKPTSCAYREILNHELRHVQIYREALPRLEQQIRTALTARFGAGPVYAAPGQGIRALEHEIDDWLRPMIRAGLHRIELAQAAIDNDEEDFRLSHACHGEVALRIGSIL